MFSPELSHIVFFDSRPGVAVSPQGDRIFATETVPAVNLWPVLIYYWPEASITGILAASTICLIYLWRRVFLRPQSHGLLYCQRCNYCLEGIGNCTVRCPECGADLLPRRTQVRGRSRRRRTAIAAAVILVLTAGLGMPHLLGVQRKNAASNWFQWWSVRAHRHAVAGNWQWLLRHEGTVTQLESVDARSGAVSEPLAFFPGASNGDIGLSSDGRWMVLATDSGIHLLNIRGQMILKKQLLRVEGVPTIRNPGREPFVGFNRESTRVYTAWENSDAALTEVWAHDVGSGRGEIFGVEPYERVGPLGLLTHGFTIAHLKTRSLLVETPDSRSDRSVEITVRTLESFDEILLRIQSPLWFTRRPVFDEERAQMYLIASDSRIDVFSLESGSQVAWIKAGSSEALAFDPHNRMLRIMRRAFLRGAVLVSRDVDASEWMPAIDLPLSIHDVRMYTDVVGKTLVVTGLEVDATRSRSNQLRIYSIQP